MKIIALIKVYLQNVREKIERYSDLWQERARRTPPRPWLISERLPIPAHIEPNGEFLEHQLSE